MPRKVTSYTDLLQHIELYAQSKKDLSQINEPSSAHSQDPITATRPGFTPPEPKMDWSTENEQLPEPPWNNSPTEMLLKDPRLTKEYTDRCEYHNDSEKLLESMLDRAKFISEVIQQAQQGTANWDTNFITQRQKDIEDLMTMIELVQGKLAPFYPCPKTDCHDHLTDPDSVWQLTKVRKTHPLPQTSNASKKKTDKEGFTSPSKTKRVKLTDHPNVSTDNPIPISNKFDALATMDTDPR
ncbi:hypothetical protein TNCT_91001 [Trichonephila clavata]|uniref:Uncharacterized protein n=1 Tax=Trichonephila clavata TaxID=2740835 RepID=A0A8X6FPC6_TRICU|nr:hypothetical protein TNCT_91001 [Trichonephila clavata]